MVKVSVVVAVYNPGRDIDELLGSIDAQTMPPDEFEVIFADDDSTDGTRERLQEWSRERSHVHVLHNTPNSGWPGRPRNLGIDRATGEYLFFADNDDKFTADALQSMYDYARQNDSDVVIAKEIGVGPGRSVPRALFRRNLPDAKLVSDPILGILTPHKLIRTALVRDNEIRFPEGRTRLEDHYFMMRCYFAAKRISVYAERPCYYWMRRTHSGDNASFGTVDPVMYYEAVERVLTVVEEHTEPGEFRDKLYSHWFQSKMLARLRGGFLLEYPQDYQESLVRELRRVSERFGLDERLLPYLGAGSRARAKLLLHASLEDIQRLAAAERGVTQEARLERLAWADAGGLELSVRSEFRYADGEPITVVRDGDRVLWDIAAKVPGLPLEPIDVTDIAPGIRLHALISDRATQDLQYAHAQSAALQADRLGATAEVSIDPADAFNGKTGKAILDLRVRLTGLGWASEVRLPVGSAVSLPSDGPSLAQGRVRAYATKGYGKLSLRFTTTAPKEPEQPGAAAAATSQDRVVEVDETSRDEAGPAWRESAGRYTRGALRRVRGGAGWARRQAQGRLRRR